MNLDQQDRVAQEAMTPLDNLGPTANLGIRGLVADATGPEIVVLVPGNGEEIPNGHPPTVDYGTDFGTAALAGAPISRTWEVRNNGGTALSLAVVTMPTGFTLTEGLASTLAPGAADTFTVQLETNTPGTTTGDISISNNDSDESPFVLRVTGTIALDARPEITISCHGISIANGDTTPSLADGTDFGSTHPDGPEPVQIFAVRNDGLAMLTLGTLTVPTGFVVTNPGGSLPSALQPGASATFTICLLHDVTGTKAGDVSLMNNDADGGDGIEVPFHFRITGTVTAPSVPANLALGRPATASTSYGGLPASNATDGNASSRWSSQFSDNEWISVDLGSVYAINRVILRWEAAYGRGYKIQVSGDAATWSNAYSTTKGDGGVDDITLSAPTSGRYVRMLGTQRATLYGYSLYEIEIYGGEAVNHAPVVSSFDKSLMQDTPLPFAAADFTAAFTDPDAGDSLQEIKIASLPSQGVLTLNNTPVTVNQEIAVTQIGTLMYTPNDAYTGSDSFQWNGSDGSLYAATEAAADLSINAAVANVALHKPATASTSYSGLPLSNATDGNTNSRWSSQFSNSQWIYVDLSSIYTINRVVLRWEAAYGRGYKIQISNDAFTWSDAYSTTTGDGGVDDLTLSTEASGRYVRMLGTQRATLYGYSLWEFEVYGGGATNHAPAVSSFSKSPMQDTALPFAAADFTAAFTDPDAGDSLQKIKITSLPTYGVLTLSSTPVTLDQEITTAQIGTFVYTPNSGYTGSDSFQWNGSDGSLYAVSGAAVNLSINAAVANLALGKTAVASTSYSGLPASNATDGNVNSRWSSQFSDSQWIYVDLGAVYTVNRVVLRWETAYGRGYKIQVSSDASTWSDVYTTTAGDGGVDDLTLAAPASGRYVRMLGTQRATAYGYSLYELEVYSGSGGVAEITALGNGASITDGDATPSAGDGTDFGSVAQGGPAISRTFTVRNDGTAALTLGTVTVPTGFTLTEGLSSSLAPGESDMFTVRLDTTTAGTKAGDLSFATNDSDENPFNFRIAGTVNAPVANLALGKTAAASTSYSGLPASNVTDGNLSSRWSSQFSDSHWIYVDLGAVFTINQVILRWEAAYGRGYKIQISNDASTWSDVYSTTTGDGGVDEITLSAPASGRYVRLLGTQRGTAYGYSLWEFEVYG